MNTKFKFSWIVKSFVFTTIIVFLSEWIQKTGFVTLPLGFRHIIILFIFLINWTLYGRTLNIPKNYKKAIILISVFLFVAFPFAYSSLLNYSLGVVFTFLFVPLFILGANTKTKPEYIIEIFNNLLVFIFIMSIIPISEAIFAGTSLRWLPGLFREVGAFGTAMNIGTIISISLLIITSKKKYLYIALFFSFGVLLTILKKTMVSNVLVWLVYFIYTATSKIRFKLILLSSILLLIGYFAVWNEMKENLELNVNYIENAGAEGHVRLGMYIASFNLVTDFFPFGSGMGTFGSLASIIGGYSNIYFDYGVSNIGANSPEDVANGHHTLLDTYWPHIFGELGFFGAIIFLYIWFFPIKKPISIMRFSSDPLIKGISFYIILTIVTIAWEGLSLYTPEVPAFIILHSGLVGLCYYHLNKDKKLIRI